VDLQQILGKIDLRAELRGSHGVAIDILASPQLNSVPVSGPPGGAAVDLRDPALFELTLSLVRRWCKLNHRPTH
jgi:hypothetical protein